MRNNPSADLGRDPTDNIGTAVRPSLGTSILSALAAAVFTVFLPEVGIFSFFAVCVFVMFLVSSRVSLPFYIPTALAAAVLCYRESIFESFFGTAVLYTFFAACIASAVAARIMLGYGLPFHRALIAFTAVGSVAALVLVAIIIRRCSLTIDGIAAAFSDYFKSVIDEALEASYDSLTESEVALIESELSGTSELLYTGLAYLPAVIVIMIELCGVLALRLTGFYHRMTGSDMIGVPERRRAELDPVYAVLFFLSILFATVGGSGVVGVCAGNIMLIMLIPAVAAGISAWRIKMRKRRALGRRGGVLPVIVVIVFALYVPVFALYVPAVYGCVTAISNALKTKKK